jgi:hypothetical protein
MVTLTDCQSCSVGIRDAPTATRSPTLTCRRGPMTAGSALKTRSATPRTAPHHYDDDCKVWVTTSRKRSRAWHAHLDELERRQARRHISAREFDSVHLGTGMEG